MSPYFWMRPLIFAREDSAITFPWYDTWEESARVLEALASVHEGLVFHDRDRLRWSAGNRMMKTTVHILILSLLVGCTTEDRPPEATERTVQTPPNDPDGQVLDQLRRAGSDLSKEHPIEFFLYFSSEESAHAAASRLRNDGFAVEVRPGALRPDWLCFTTKRMIPEHEDISQLRVKFETLANELGGQYDGWGTPVVK